MLPKEMKEPEQVGKDKWKTSLFFFFFFPPNRFSESSPFTVLQL